MSADANAMKVVFNNRIGATYSMDLPHITGARHYSRNYDPADHAAYVTFDGAFSYQPVSGAWKGEIVGVGFTGYYDRDGTLWASSFVVAGDHDSAISVRSGRVGILLDFMLDDSQSMIDILGVDATGNRRVNYLTGGDLGDTLRGKGGNDVLKGGGGSDLLVGGTGQDDLWGNRGADVFQFRSVNDSPARSSARDIIHDFTRADRIDLRAIDADITHAGNNRFDFIGSHRFHGDAGELRYSRGVVSGDTDGDRHADFSIEIANHARLQEDYFVL